MPVKSTITNSKLIEIRLSNGKTLLLSDNDNNDQIILSQNKNSIPVPKSNLMAFAAELIKLAK